VWWSLEVQHIIENQFSGSQGKWGNILHIRDSWVSNRLSIGLTLAWADVHFQNICQCLSLM